MTDNDKMEFARLLMAAGELYNREISKELKRMYFDALKDLPIQVIEAALNAHVNDPDAGQFFPKPADLRRHLLGTAKQQAEAVEDRAAVAWAAILGQIQRTGAHGNLVLEDKQALATVQAMGGWRNLCMTLTEDLTWRRKDFIGLYETFERTPLEVLPASLPGIIELGQHKAQGTKSLGSLMGGIVKRISAKGED